VGRAAEKEGREIERWRDRDCKRRRGDGEKGYSITKLPGGRVMYLLRTDSWYLERVIFLMAGCMNTLSIILILTHSIYWLILTGLVSVNLLVFATTGFCPSAALLHRMGVRCQLGRAGTCGSQLAQNQD
jgi:hypothetical protein